MKNLVDRINKRVLEYILHDLRLPTLYICRKDNIYTCIDYDIVKVENRLLEGLKYKEGLVDENDIKKVIDEIIEELSINDLLLSNIKYIREEGKRLAINQKMEGWGYINTMAGIGQK